MTEAPAVPEIADILAEPPFFILGSGRSGTTLLQSLLSAHSRLTVTPETHFCRRSQSISGAPIDGAPPNFDAWWREWTVSPRFLDLQVSPERCLELMEGRRDFAAALAAMLAAFGETAGKPRVGEKTPGHMHFVPWLLKVFPDARIIALQRDPRAVIASIAKAPWSVDFDPARSFLVRATRLHLMERQGRTWARINGELLPRIARDPRVMRLRYEDLVQDPEETLREVCAFLGETFEPAMLGERSAPAASASVARNETWRKWGESHHAASNAPVNTASMEKWRSELTPLEIAAIEAGAAEVMTALGLGEPASRPAERRRARSLARSASKLSDVELRLRRALRPLRRRR